MPKYRKKPVVVEAFQMTKEASLDRNLWPEWLRDAGQKPIAEPGCLCVTLEPGPDARWEVMTLEGPLTIGWDDFIIKGVQDELYPCKPDIFNETYDYVEE